MQQALRQVDLVAIAGVDVFDGAADGVKISGTVEVAVNAACVRKWIKRLGIHPKVGERRIDRRRPKRAVQTPLDEIQAARGSPGPPARVGLRQAGGNDPRPPFGVIECDHPIVKTQRQVGRLELVAPWPQQPLDVMAEVVAEQPGRPTLERRQSGRRLGPPQAQIVLQHGERVGLARPGAVVPDVPAQDDSKLKGSAVRKE